MRSRTLMVFLSTGALSTFLHANSMPHPESAAYFSGDPVSFNFQDRDIREVAGAMATLLKLDLSMDPAVKGTMTLYTEQPLTPRAAYIYFLAELDDRGYSVVESGRLFKVVPNAFAVPQVEIRSVSTGGRVVPPSIRQNGPHYAETEGVPTRSNGTPVDDSSTRALALGQSSADVLAKSRVAQGPAIDKPRSTGLGGRSGPVVALTLTEAIDRSLHQNLGLLSGTLVMESAALEIPKAQARFHPNVGFTLDASGVRAASAQAAQTSLTTRRLSPIVTQQLPTGGSLALSSDIVRGDPSVGRKPAVTVSAVQPVLRGGRTYVATQPLRNAEFDLRIADYSLKAQVLGVTADTKTAYYNVLLAEKVIEVTEAATARDRDLIAASTAMFNARLVTKRDVYSAELSLAQDSARLVSARADLETSKDALLSVLGLPIATDIELVDKEINFEPVPLEPERLISTAIRRRPEIVAAQERLAKSVLNIRVAHNAQLPQLDLVASYGRAQTTRTLPGNIDVATDVWTAGVVASFPLGNVAARSTLSQAELERKRIQIELEQTKRNVEIGVRAAVIKLRKSEERIKSLTLAIEQAKGKLEVGKAQFVLGQATNLDITDAQQAILNAETDFLTAIIGYNIGLAELEASIGGPIHPN